MEHSGRSVTYEWGEGAGAGEVQWAAFFSDSFHEVLPVVQGARVTLAYDLLAHPPGGCGCMGRCGGWGVDWAWELSVCNDSQSGECIPCM